MLKTKILGILAATVGVIGVTGWSLETQSQTQNTQSQILVQDTQQPERSPDVIYVPTPQSVVEEMLELAKVNKNDVIYDLGSGDGRLPITAASKYGARGIGIDINPERIREANENAQEAGVTERVKFLQQDLFTTDISDASVVTLYLLPDLNVKLRPKLFQQLKPGTRVVSHDFDMGDWKPDRTVTTAEGSTIYYWVIPENIPANLPEAKTTGSLNN
jgi:predicted O-methyltransferase YrrM